MLHSSISPSRLLGGALLALAFSSFAGCGNSDGLVDVSGNVTFDGQPLADALVSFYPADGGRPSHGTTDTDGHYTLTYTDEKTGAKAGSNTVKIVSAQVQGEGQPAGGSTAKKLPAKYNDQSELTADVPAGGSDSINFDLTSG